MINTLCIVSPAAGRKDGRAASGGSGSASSRRSPSSC